MADDPQTQKQIAGKYKGNLSYFRENHFFRRLRLMLAVLATLIAVGGIVWFAKYGSDSYYNPGPISKNHASFKDDCRRCHLELTERRARFQHVEEVSGSLNEALQNGVPQSTIGKLGERALRGVSFANIDRACLQCHEHHDLHAPQLGTMQLRAFRREISEALTGSCSSCHREHAGPEPMGSPASEFCASCHGNQQRLADSLRTVALPRGAYSDVGILRRLDDGMVHFITPPTRAKRLETFNTFEGRHPDFAYEAAGLRDPNMIRYNHARHEGADIPPVNGRKMECTFCHQPTGDGTYYGQIAFNTTCAACHSLQIDARNPELRVPHGAPQLARNFLRSLDHQYDELAARRGLRGDAAVQWANAQRAALLATTSTGSGVELERRLFYTANPYRSQSAAQSGAQFPGCAYCHDVKGDPRSTDLPQITPPLMAERYLHRGRFSHVSHKSVNCAQCHAASASHDTADILMPPKQTCTSCHHQQGTAPSDCYACHQYHSPTEAGNQLRAIQPRADMSLRDALLSRK